MARSLIFFTKPDSWFTAGFTTRTFGDIKTSSNQKKLLSHFNNPEFFALNQVHGIKIHDISGFNKRQKNLIGDGLTTKTRRLLLLIKTADCAPVIIADQLRKRVTILHVGRKGLGQGIIENAFAILKPSSQTCDKLDIYIGPFIEKSCYLLDLQKIMMAKFKKLGVSKKQINFLGGCTKCQRELYFSHRKGDRQRMGTFVMIY